MKKSEKIAFSFFKDNGYSARVIPRQKGAKSADFEVKDGCSTYIVEVKEKLHTGSKIEVKSFAEESSEIQIECEPHSHSNRLDGILKHGTNQLSETLKNLESYKLIWFFSEGPNAEMITRRLIQTFYGVAYLRPINKNGIGVNCFYFDYSAAYSLPLINGIIVVENEFMELCINEFSNNYHAFKETKLVKQFGQAVYDPSTLQNKPGTLVLRSSISRKNKLEIIEELERKTKIRYTVIPMKQYKFSTSNQ